MKESAWSMTDPFPGASISGVETVYMIRDSRDMMDSGIGISRLSILPLSCDTIASKTTRLIGLHGKAVRLAAGLHERVYQGESQLARHIV
jgi:hypothetical protein